MRLVCISDTHGCHDAIVVPDGDVLLHAGDLTAHGELDELIDVNTWLGNLPHRHKLVIAGNHDYLCEQLPEVLPQIFTNATYLQDTSITIDGRTYYGHRTSLEAPLNSGAGGRFASAGWPFRAVWMC